MKQSFPFIPSLRTSMASDLRNDLVPVFTDYYENGEKLKSFHTLLDFFNKDIRRKYGNEQGTEFHIPHGSILLNIKIENGQFYLWIDFLKLPSSNRVAFLREIMNVNVDDLYLARIIKVGDLLKIEYHCSFEDTHPNKLFRLIGNVCTFADAHDDEYCAKFGAQRCYMPHVIPYSDDDLDRVLDGIKAIGGQTVPEVKSNSDTRSYGIAWNVLAASLYQIYYFMQPQGKLQYDYIEELDRFDDDDDDRSIEEVINGGMELLKKLMSMGKEDLKPHLYHIESVISPKVRSTLSAVQERMNPVYEEVTEAMQTEGYNRAYVRIRYSFYESLYYFDMQDDIYAVILDALKDSAGKSLKEAAQILYAALEKIIRGKVASEERKEKDSGLHTKCRNVNTGQKGDKLRYDSASSADDMEVLKSKLLASIDQADLRSFISMSKEIELRLLNKMERKDSNNDQGNL